MRHKNKHEQHKNVPDGNSPPKVGRGRSALEKQSSPFAESRSADSTFMAAAACWGSLQRGRSREPAESISTTVARAGAVAGAFDDHAINFLFDARNLKNTRSLVFPTAGAGKRVRWQRRARLAMASFICHHLHCGRGLRFRFPPPPVDSGDACLYLLISYVVHKSASTAATTVSQK